MWGGFGGSPPFRFAMRRWCEDRQAAFSISYDAATSEGMLLAYTTATGLGPDADGHGDGVGRSAHVEETCTALLDGP